MGSNCKNCKKAGKCKISKYSDLRNIKCIHKEEKQWNN